MFMIAMSPVSRRALLASVVLVWCAVVGLGIRAMVAYATTAGDMSAPPARWPEGTRLSQGGDFTIAMFIQPDCPCSRASLHELAAIRRSAATRLEIVVAGPDMKGELWDAAGRIPGAVRVIDDGREAARFGARTSGFVVVYDRAGLRRFAGGITGSRGHVGDNVGRDAVQRIVDGRVHGIVDGPRSHTVFGCALGGGP